MTIEKEYPPPPTPREIKILQEVERLRDLADSMGQDNIRYLQEIQRLEAYVEEWKMRYETARLAHEEGRRAIERLQSRIVTLEGMLGEANIAIPE
jgi:chromosome segregation ATPase